MLKDKTAAEGSGWMPSNCSGLDPEHSLTRERQRFKSFSVLLCYGLPRHLIKMMATFNFSRR
jgi:hypothetical protein